MKTATISEVVVDDRFNPPSLVVRFAVGTGRVLGRDVTRIFSRRMPLTSENVRSLVESATNQTLTDDELAGFDLSSLVDTKFEVPPEAS